MGLWGFRACRICRVLGLLGSSKSFSGRLLVQDLAQSLVSFVGGGGGCFFLGGKEWGGGGAGGGEGRGAGGQAAAQSQPWSMHAAWTCGRGSQRNDEEYEL